jgi:type I restriction enzyme, S subunit
MENLLPVGWVEVPLEDCIQVLDNQRIPVNSEERAGRKGDVPYYGATGQVGWIDTFLFDEELVLVGEDGAPFFDKTKNIAFIIDGKSWVNNHAHVIKAITTITSNKYLNYYLNLFDFTGFVHGTTRLKLTQEKLRKIPFPLAPLSEQTRIVAALDEYMAHLRTAETALEGIPSLLRQFRQKVLAMAVSGELTAGWREELKIKNGKLETAEILIDNIIKTKIKKKEKLLPAVEAEEYLFDTPESWLWCRGEIIADFVDPHPSHRTPTEVNEGVPYVGMKDISNDGTIHFSSARKVSFKILEEHKARYSLKMGDFIFGKIGTIGNPVLLVEPFDYTLSANIILVQPNREIILSAYFYYFMLSPVAEQHLFENKSESSYAVFGMKKARNIPFALPTLSEQTEIVRRVEELLNIATDIETAYATARTELKVLPQVLLSKAFKGELLAPSVSAGLESVTMLLERIKSEKARLASAKKGGRKGKQ